MDSPKISFKSFVAHREGQKSSEKQAQSMLGTKDTELTYHIPDKMVHGSKLAGHKFVDTINGPWNVKLFTNRGELYAEVNPPKGSADRRFYVVPKSAEEEFTFEAFYEAVHHSKVIGHVFSSKSFSYDKATKTFSAEAAGVHGFDTRLWNDFTDIGFGIRSVKTNDVVYFTLRNTHKDADNDVTQWTFKVYNPSHNPKLNGLKVIIFND